MSNNKSTNLSADIVTYLQEKKDLTLKEIGELMGLSESFICHVKRGTHNFTMARLSTLEKALNKPLPLLFLELIDYGSVSKEMKPQYKALRKALTVLGNL